MSISAEDKQLLMKVLARDQVVDAMNLRVYLAANEMREQEIERLWVREPDHMKTASYGKNWGYYVGMDSIISYYVTRHNTRMKQYLSNYCAMHTNVADIPENIGYGYSSIYPISAPSVQVSDDCSTVKALFYSVGYQNIPLPDGSVQALWVAQKVAADFIKEEDGYRLWHLLEISDSTWEPGINYHDDMPVFEAADDPLREEFGTPDIEVLTHDRQFCWADNYPAMPVPYSTFSDDISWGPEGFRPFMPSIRARNIILAAPTQPVGLSSAGARKNEEAAQ